MKQNEYIKTIIYNRCMINVGISDAGQTYFLEYLEDGQLQTECVGPYVADYEDYIEWRFGRPEINCPIYHEVVTTDTECCDTLDKSLCLKCRKRWNNIDYAAWQKRNEEFAKWLEEHKNETL